MTWQLSVTVIGCIVAVLILFSNWIFKLFPSIEGVGERILRWLCTYGPLWPREPGDTCQSPWPLDQPTAFLR